MKNRIYTVLLATYLIVGCSGGGGTSGAGSSGSTVIVGGLLLSANLSNSENFSIDTFRDVCNAALLPPISPVTTPPTPPIDEDYVTQMDTFTLTATNVSSFTDSLFPFGITFHSYSISFILQTISPSLPQTADSLRLSTNNFDVTSTSTNDSSLSTSVIIADLANIKKEYGSKDPIPSGVNNYIVTITMRGTIFSGEGFSITASNVFEFGNFDNCDN